MGCTASTEQQHHTKGSHSSNSKSGGGGSHKGSTTGSGVGTTSRDVQQQQKQAESFFPPPMESVTSSSPIPSTTTTNSMQKNSLNQNNNNTTNKSSIVKESRPSTTTSTTSNDVQQQQQQFMSPVKKKTPYVPPAPITMTPTSNNSNNNTTSTQLQQPHHHQTAVIMSPQQAPVRIGSPGGVTTQVKKQPQHPLPRPYNPLTAMATQQQQQQQHAVGVPDSDTNHAVRHGGGRNGGISGMDDGTSLTMNDDTTTAGVDSIYYDDDDDETSGMYNINDYNTTTGNSTIVTQTTNHTISNQSTTSSTSSSNYHDIIGNLPQESISSTTNNDHSMTSTSLAAFSSSSTNTTNNKKSKNTSSKQQKQKNTTSTTNPYPNYTSNNHDDDDDDDDDDETEDEFHGLLDFHQSGFDPSAISVITNMTLNSNDNQNNDSSSGQQNQPSTMTDTHPTTMVDTTTTSGIMNATTNTSISQYEYPKEAPQPSSSSGMRFDELYRLKGVLGTGAFSTVREGFHKSSQHISFAVKCINRKKLSKEDEAALLDEVSILKEMDHEHIIRIFDFFVEPSTYYLVMERMRGGELFDRIVTKAYYNEKEARDTCKIVLEAVSYCHENHVAHRDLKPENLLLLSDVDDSAVKIADFGFAKKVYEPNSLTTQCGTPGYVAPEILEGTAYDERADMWSVGVILYILLGGYPPFIESTQRDLFRKIRRGDYEFHEEYWGTVSSEAKELISSLLTVDRTVRLTADEALENAWILGDDAKLAQRDLGDNLNKLRNFNGKRKFRAAVSTVMAVNKLNLVGKEFFTHYGKEINPDANGSGDLSIY